MATPTNPLSDWSQAPEAWQSYAKTIPQLENMPDNAYDALREKYFQEQVLPSMMKQGANYSPEASKQAFFEKTERPSRLPHSIEAAKTAASLLANQAAKAFVAPFAGTNVADAQKMQLALERRGQGLEGEATREWMSPTLPKVAGELVGQAPFWMAGMEGAGAAAKAAKVSPAAARLFNIGAGGIIQGSYDAAKAQDGHRLVEGVGGAAMGAAGVAAFEGLGAFLRGKGMTPEEADAVVATTKGSAAPREEAIAASAAASSPNLTADINSWLADQIKVADRNGVPKGATIAEPNARVKIQMTGADGAPYNVGGAVGIKLGDLPAVVGCIAQHLEKGGSITSVLGDVPELHSLLRQFEALNKVRGEYDLSVPLKGQAESVVPTEGVVAPASQPASLEDLETQAWNAIGFKQVTSPRSLQVAAPQLKLSNKVAKQLFDRMYPEVDESPAASPLASSPQSSAGEGVAPVEPSGTPSPGEAPGAALVARKQLSELRSYIGPGEMPHLDKLEVLASGRVRNKVDGSIYKNVAEAIQAEPKAGVNDVEDFDRQMAGSWVTNKGRVIKLTAAMPEHEMVADVDESIGKGWVRHIDNGLEYDPRVARPQDLIRAAKLAAEVAESTGRDLIQVDRHTGELKPNGDAKLDTRYYSLKQLDALGYDISKAPGWETPPPGSSMEPKFGAEEPEYGANPNAPNPSTPGGWSFKETPQVSRLYGPGMTVEQTARASGAPTSMVDQLQGAAGAKGVTYPGSVTASGKPLVVLTEPSRGLIFHEMTHAHILATGLDPIVNASIEGVKPEMINALQGAFSPELKQMYGGRINAEELYTYSATAVRTDDQATIAKFADADGGKEEFLDWVGQTTNKLKEEVAATPDSLHRRVFERKLDEVNRRASSYIQDIQNGTFNVEGLSLSWERGKFIAETPDGQAHTFANRTQLAEWLDRNHNEPLNAPSAVDESSLPKGTPRYAADLPGFTNKKPPIQTDPPSPTLSEREPAKGGMMLAWRFFQPFQDWIDIVARKNKWPELSNLFGGKLQGAVENVESHIYDNQKMLKSTLGLFPPKRQSDLYTYLKASEADRPQVAKEFNFTGSEANAIKEFETKASGLADSYGSSLHNFVRNIAPSLRAKGYDLDTLVAGGAISKEDVAFWKPLLEHGRVDPNDTNLLRLADGWVKGGARKTYLNDTIKEAEKFLNQRNVEGDRLVGDLKNALQRHLDFIRGMPDQSQQVVNAALGHVTELVNAGISKVNTKLPERFQIEPINSIPQDILGKWVMYSYAGTIGLRPAIPIRAAMQMFITGYPILGGKYLAKGMGRMFPAIGEGTASEAYQIADKYGWLLKPRDYGNLYTGEGNIEQSATAKLAQRSLQPLLWGHNAARLAVGWGHVERFMAALRYKSDPDAFLSKSALNWLPTFKQQSYLREVQSLGTRDASDLAYRAAKDLVDVSQWNYRRGANPGLYEYGLGRLFGQYGTWPLNYIEFARKLATHPDKGTQIASLARLVLAHGAILKAGEAAGVDTGQWVFSQPMAYGGGPLFQAVRAVPGSLDFETQKGVEARRELIRPLWPVPIFVPGGMAAQQLIDAVNSNSPDIYKILMGFKPLKAGEELKGEHGLLP